MRQTSEGQGGGKGKRVGKAKQLFIYGKRNLLKSVEIKTNFIIYLLRYHFVCNAHTDTYNKKERKRGKEVQQLEFGSQLGKLTTFFFSVQFQPKSDATFMN